MKRRAFLFYRLAIIASVSISSVICGTQLQGRCMGGKSGIPLCQAKE